MLLNVYTCHIGYTMFTLEGSMYIGYVDFLCSGFVLLGKSLHKIEFTLNTAEDNLIRQSQNLKFLFAYI